MVATGAGYFAAMRRRVAAVTGPSRARSDDPSFTRGSGQIAPTMLRLLGIDPNELQAVRAEHTEVLPQVG